MSDPTRMPMQTPQDLFVHELSSTLDAEQTVIRMLEEAQGLVETPQLKAGLQMHAEQSMQQAQRIQQILDQMGAMPHPVQCHAARGMLLELMEAQQSQPSPMVLEGLVTGGACKTEHFEIAAYTGLIEKARALGLSEATQLLQQSLQEEQQMLQQVEQISQQLTQQMAGMDIPLGQQGNVAAM